MGEGTLDNCRLGVCVRSVDNRIEEELFEALPEAPEWPEDEFTAVNLTYYPRTREGMTPVQNMFESYWDLLQFRYKKNWRWPSMRTGEGYLRFLEGCDVSPGTLRWEVIDLAAHWDKTNGMIPRDKVSTGSAHFGVMAAAAHHTKWVQSWDGVNVPYPTIGGLQLTIPGRHAWTYLPYLYWDRDHRQFELYAYYASYCHDHGWSVPSLRE